MTRLRTTFSTLAALAAATLAPDLVRAQQQQGAAQPTAPAANPATVAAPVNASAELAIRQMSTKLRNVLAAQENYYSDNGTYTTNMAALSKYDPSLAPTIVAKTRRDSVSVQVIFAGGRGWTGVASHWGLRGRSCVVYVGASDELPKLPITRTDRRTPTEEGAPTCDGAPALGAPPAAPPAAPQSTAPAAPPARSH